MFGYPRASRFSVLPRYAFVFFPCSTYNPPSLTGGSNPTAIDLSKAIKLRDVTFSHVSLNVEWVALTLQSITPRHRGFQHVCIQLPHEGPPSVEASVNESIGEVAHRRWLALDHVLVQLWESHSIRLTCIWPGGQRERGNLTGCLLPEATKRGIVKLVEQCRYQ